MNKQKDKLLTPNQVTFLLMGFAIGPSFLRLPNALVESAEQDGWITAIIALLYPIYVVLIGGYIIKKHPKENILIISKRYFGTLLGSILNFIFMLQFILYSATITGHFIVLARTYIVAFLSPLKVVIITITLGAYSASKGIKSIGKTCQLISYIFILIFLLSLTALNYGSILNLKPFFGAGLWNILRTTKTCAYFYTGWEALLLFHPYVEDVKSIKKSALKGIAISGMIWVWSVFITIFYVGIDIIPKTYWSFIVVFESIQIPVINNFRYVFMFTWILVILRCLTNYYYASVFSLNEFIKIDTKKLCVFIYPFVLYLSIKLSNEILREQILALSAPVFVIFNLVFITLIALIISMKFKPPVRSTHVN